MQLLEERSRPGVGPAGPPDKGSEEVVGREVELQFSDHAASKLERRDAAAFEDAGPMANSIQRLRISARSGVPGNSRLEFVETGEIDQHAAEVEKQNVEF